jgi:hypothetical protein
VVEEQITFEDFLVHWCDFFQRVVTFYMNNLNIYNSCHVSMNVLPVVQNSYIVQGSLLWDYPGNCFIPQGDDLYPEMKPMGNHALYIIYCIYFS